MPHCDMKFIIWLNTEREKTSRRLRCAQNIAHRAPQYKSEFLAHMNESLNEPSVGLGFSAGTYGFTACGGNAVREVEV